MTNLRRSSVSPDSREKSQEGMAYILALLVMLVLTMVGVSLAGITSTERQIAASERSVQRVLYTADWGIDASTARALVQADYSSGTYTVAGEDVPHAAALNMRHEIEVSPFVPILAAACNLCQVNGAGQYGTKSYFMVTHAVASRSTRMVGVGAATSSKTLASMLDVQPWQLPVESLMPLTQPAELAKVKF